MKRKSILAITLAFIMLIAMPMSVFAASNPYKDVSVKKVGKASYKAIVYVKEHKGYKDVVSGNKFYPNKKITRWEFLTMLGNFYGDKKVPISMKDIRNANKKVTSKWACAKMVEVASYGFGMKISWEGSSTTLTRAAASRYLKIFADFDEAFKPIK